MPKCTIAANLNDKYITNSIPPPLPLSLPIWGLAIGTYILYSLYNASTSTNKSNVNTKKPNVKEYVECEYGKVEFEMTSLPVP